MSKNNILLIILGLLFHTLILSALISSNSDTTIKTSTNILLVSYLALSTIAWLFHNYKQHKTGIGISFLTPMLLLPFYLYLFNHNWALATTGIITTLIQGKYLLYALPKQQNLLINKQIQKQIRTDLILFSGIGCSIITFIGAGHDLINNNQQQIIAWLFLVTSLIISIPQELKYFPINTKKPYIEHPILIIGLAILPFTPTHPELLSITLYLLCSRQTIVTIRFWYNKRGGAELQNYLYNRPAQLLVFSFLIVIMIGTLLLTLPIASTNGNNLNFLNAIFTSTSATCVTGLIVVDTGSYFSTFGQTVILILIQIGGLGFMTISTFFAIMLGRSIGLKSEFTIGSMIGEQKTKPALQLLKFIVLSTFAIELFATLLLACQFIIHTNYSLPKALYYGLFHSISAFCNGGFSLYNNSLENYSATAPMIPFIISILIILGGVGFAVLFALCHWYKTKMPVEANVKLVITTTILLLIFGTIFFFFSEQHNSLNKYNFSGKVVNAWFQSVTARTAGFNSVDLTQFSPVSLLVMMTLMFIGAAPGSTGGGVKVTTIAVLLLVIRSVFTGRQDVTYSNRKISQETIYNAIAIICMAGLFLGTATIILLITQPQHSQSQLLFEAISAFGTVGLSLGITSKLTAIGKITIITLMFVGRIGTLTLLVMLRPHKQSTVRYPFAKIMIG